MEFVVCRVFWASARLLITLAVCSKTIFALTTRVFRLDAINELHSNQNQRLLTNLSQPASQWRRWDERSHSRLEFVTSSRRLASPIWNSLSPYSHKTTQKFIKALPQFRSSLFSFFFLFVRNMEGVGDQLGEEERAWLDPSEAVKTHMNEFSGLKKNKTKRMLSHEVAQVPPLEGQLLTCEGPKYHKKEI